VVEEPPFPDHVALHVHLDDCIHLRAVVRTLARVGAGGNRLLVGDGSIRDGQGRGGVELLVEDAHPIVVRRVALTLLNILPDQLAVPINFFETLKPARIVPRSVK
jgi:hypothetical protein